MPKFIHYFHYFRYSHYLPTTQENLSKVTSVETDRLTSGVHTLPCPCLITQQHMLQRTYLTHQLFTVTPSNQQHQPFSPSTFPKIHQTHIYGYENTPLYRSQIHTLDFSLLRESSDKAQPATDSVISAAASPELRFFDALRSTRRFHQTKKERITIFAPRSFRTRQLQLHLSPQHRDLARGSTQNCAFTQESARQSSSHAFLRNAGLDRRRQHNTPNRHEKRKYTLTAILSGLY